MKSLTTKNIFVKYQDQFVLEDVSIELESNKLIALIGPNGAGKSTFIKACLSLVATSSGGVRFFNDSFENVRARIAYVPQRSSVDWDFPTSVLDVVLMGLYVHKGLFTKINSKDKLAANEAIERVGLSEFKDRQISQLSGGQQQRVFIARALVQNPDLFLLDEPFAGVDSKSEQAIIEILKSLIKENKTVLVVHHDLSTVKDYFDQVIMLNKKVIAQGDVEVVFNNENISTTYGINFSHNL
jgi:manganese/zinc/iron transport system ATP- binding protein